MQCFMWSHNLPVHSTLWQIHEEISKVRLRLIWLDWFWCRPHLMEKITRDHFLMTSAMDLWAKAIREWVTKYRGLCSWDWRDPENHPFKRYEKTFYALGPQSATRHERHTWIRLHIPTLRRWLNVVVHATMLTFVSNVALPRRIASCRVALCGPRPQDLQTFYA